MDAALLQLLKEGKKIQAVKLYKDSTKASLVDSKQSLYAQRKGRLLVETVLLKWNA